MTQPDLFSVHARTLADQWPLVDRLRKQAACRKDAAFPHRPESARAPVCAGCPVRDDCEFLELLPWRAA